MELRSLKYFIAVAENGSITAAAQSLHMSQPPLSTQIRQLEEELGVRLLVRKSRSVELTDAGRLFYKRAQTIVDFIGSACDEISEFEKGDNGTVRIGVSSSCAELMLSFVHMGYSGEYPKVTYEISEANTYDLLNKLNRNVIDIAIVRSPCEIDSSKHECCMIREESLVAVGKEIFFLSMANEESVSLKQLRNKPLITYSRWVDVLKAEFKTDGVLPKFYCVCDNASTAVDWARAGHGVAIVPESASLALDESLEVREIEAQRLNSTIYGILRKGAYITPCTEVFWELLANEGRLAYADV